MMHILLLQQSGDLLQTAWKIIQTLKLLVLHYANKNKQVFLNRGLVCHKLSKAMRYSLLLLLFEKEDAAVC